MNATTKSIIVAALAAGIEPLVQAATEGPVHWDRVALRSLIASTGAVLLYLRQSPLPPSRGEQYRPSSR